VDPLILSFRKGKRTMKQIHRENDRGRLKAYFNNLSFARKLILLFLCGIVIPMLVQNVVYYRQTEKNIQRQMLEKLNEAMDDKAEKLNSALLNALSLAKSNYSNEALYRYLDYEYGRDLDYLIRYQEALQALFSETNLYLYQVRNVLVYTDNDTLFNGSYIRKLSEMNLETLGENLLYLNVQPIAGEQGIYFRVAYEDSSFPKTYDSRSLSIISIYDHYRQYAKYGKLLRVDLDLGNMEEILLETNLFENMFLTDSDGSVVVAANGYSNSGAMDRFCAEDMEQREDVMILSRDIGKFPLTLYGVYDKDMISQEFRQSRVLSIGISLLCLLFALACVYAAVGNMNRRLYKLVEQSKEIAKGNFVQSKSANEGNDEFSVLENSMNQMSVQLVDLIDREYKAQIIRAEQEKEANKARFLALQSQINPHFMFNALESIRLKSIIKGETETADMIKYMAKMFRNLIEWENNIITLKEEINFLDEFLHIQNYRFEDEFSYEINVSEQALSCMVPKMMLQPLVENACVHGVEALSDNRWVRIRACVEESWLKLEVEDNGGGMPPEKLQELKAMLKGETNAGRSVGLWNVYRRLVLYYGEEFRFDIDSVQGQGTRCVICIPARDM